MTIFNLKYTSEEIFVIVMQVIYFASFHEIGNNNNDAFFIIGYIIAGYMAILSCIKKRISLAIILKLLLILSLMVASALNSEGREFILLVVYLIVLKDSDEDKILKSFFFGNLLSLLISLVFYIVSIPNYEYIGDNNYITLGFKNQNFFGLLIFDLVALYFLIGKNNIYKYFVLVATGLFCWSIVNCRSASIAIFILGALVLLKRFLDKKGFFILFLKYSYTIMACISIYIGNIGISNSLLLLLNEVLSGRVVAWNEYFVQKPITLLGSFFYAYDFYALDNAYLYLLFRYGILVFLSYGIAYYYVAKRAIKQEAFTMQVVIISLSFYSLMEFSPMSVLNHIGLALLTTQRKKDKVMYGLDCYSNYAYKR